MAAIVDGYPNVVKLRFSMWAWSIGPLIQRGRSVTRPKRNKDVKACPNANRWMQQHPVAAQNLRRIIKLMNGRYTGDYQGYINRNADFVEYRFEPVEDERYFRSVHIFARQKHVIVRFSGLPKLKKTGPGLSKTLKNAHGNDYYALEFSAPIDGGWTNWKSSWGRP